jgi:alkylation response protein AidB-like acyl-CoA dehydrogenase
MNASAALLGNLRSALAGADPHLGAAGQLQRLVGAGLDRPPRPGSGATLSRWQALAAVAQFDLSLGKLYEGHTDALAILAELGTPPEGSAELTTWGVWAAEAPQGRTTIETGADGSIRLHGAKCWCSGAASASDALLTAWHPDGRGPQLVSVRLRQPGVRVSDAAWRAVGMAASASLDVAFDGAPARLIGEPGDYLRRPGFWQGGAGIAACWYGGALALADALRRSATDAAPAARSPFGLAALGRVDVALQSTAALLRECAAWIDANASGDASQVALRARLRAEACATVVLAEVGQAMGAAPFCRDAAFARAAADLPVFIRQSHAERDLAALGQRVLESGASPWTL